MGRSERVEAAREAVRLARQASVRPWWVTRALRGLARTPIVLFRFVVAFFQGLAEVLAELLVAFAALGLTLGVSLLVRWGWEHSPVATILLVAGTIAFVVFGGVEFFRERRSGRLAAIAVGAFSFVFLWALALMPLMPRLEM